MEGDFTVCGGRPNCDALRVVAALIFLNKKPVFKHAVYLIVELEDSVAH